MTAWRVLLVEDDADQREALAACVAAPEREVRTAGTLAQARALLRAWAPDAVITDHHLPDGTGLTLIDEARALADAPALVLVTAYGTVSLAVEALRRGALDVQVKPVDPDVLLATLRRALEARDLARENRDLKARLEAQPAPVGVVADSPGMREVLRLVRRLAPTRSHVLVTGESGTGKEVVAQLLHLEGRHPDGPFVALNCGALAEGVLESELFGHVRGAFTGAVRDHAGVFEQADGGTLFLDEIGEIPPAVQVRLLRVLETRSVVRVGEGRERHLDFRLVAATNRDLARDAADGRFRDDLRYRLEVLRIHLPPLRERREDVLPLARLFVTQAARRNDVKPLPLSDGALDLLRTHPFPGNARQLRNAIERALLLAGDRPIEADDLDLAGEGREAGTSSASHDLPQALAAFERAFISRALREVGGSVSQAAERLGLPERTLRYKLGKLSLEPDRFRAPSASGESSGLGRSDGND